MTQTKIPSYWTMHWAKDGHFSGSWWQGNKDKPPMSMLQSDGWFVIFHPEQSIETTLLPVQIDRRGGFAISLKEIDMNSYVKKGSKLTLSQRLRGTL